MLSLTFFFFQIKTSPFILSAGTYPGAIISVKKEPASSAALSASLASSNFTPILPAVPNTVQQVPLASVPTVSTVSVNSTNQAMKLPVTIAAEFTKVNYVCFVLYCVTRLPFRISGTCV